MQQKLRVPLLSVIQLFLWFALDTIAAEPSCDPPCIAGQEQCQQVFNTNGQYACVGIVSPSTQAASPPTSTAMSSPAAVPAGCRSCTDGQTCEQVLNSNQYHCVDSSTRAATSPTTPASPTASVDIPAGCQGCSQAQMCEQVLNSNQYHCVNNLTRTATPSTPLASPAKTPVPAGCQACTPNQLCRQVYNSNQYQCVDNSTVVAAPAPSNSSSASVNSSACKPACANDEACEQVFNSKQYACQPKKGATPPTAVSTPVAAVAPVTPGLAEPALSSQAASPSTSKGGLSGEHVCLGAPQHAVIQQQLQQQSCNTRKLTRHSMPTPTFAYTKFLCTRHHCALHRTCLVQICTAAHCAFSHIMIPVWLVVGERHMIPDAVVVPHAGGAIFAIILAALILLTAMALAGFIIHSKQKSSYVR